MASSSPPKDHMVALAGLLQASTADASASKQTGASGKTGKQKKKPKTKKQRKKEKQQAKRDQRRDDGGAQESTGAAALTPQDIAAEAPTLPDLLREASSNVGTGASTVLQTAITSGQASWDRTQLPHSMGLTDDGLTVFKLTATGWAGALGSALYSTGIHCFAMRVMHPVDDHFWVGVASPDCALGRAVKKNKRCIVWSGGSTASQRPGTMRVHGEKFRNRAQYGHGDVIGCIVDATHGDVDFLLNGVRVEQWRGVLRGPVSPFVLTSIANGPAATLLQWDLPRAAAAASGSAARAGVESRAGVVVGGAHGTKPLPSVDGSLLEGGGQVLRVALACGALLGRQLHVRSIRAGRPRPGLGHQHSTGVKLVADLCGASLWPDAIQYGGHCEGMTELRMWPGEMGLRGGTFVADTHTAGAVTLLLQAALPAALLGPRPTASPPSYSASSTGSSTATAAATSMGAGGAGGGAGAGAGAGAEGDGATASTPTAADGVVHLQLSGGTNVSFSPPADFIAMVLFPLLSQQCGIPPGNLKLDIKRRGFYPRGGGEVEATIVPMSCCRGAAATATPSRQPCLRAFNLVDRGKPVRVTGVVYASGTARRLRSSIAGLARGEVEEWLGAGVEVSVTVDADGGTSAQAAAEEQGRAADATATAQAKLASGGADGLTRKQRRALHAARAARNEGVAGCLLVIETSTGCRIPGDALVVCAGKQAGRGPIQAGEVARAAVRRLAEAWDAGGAVCEHTMDQLVVFMALADGHSKVLCPGPTSITSQHLATAIHFTQLLVGAKFTVTPAPELTPKSATHPCLLVECDGVGYKGQALARAGWVAV